MSRWTGRQLNVMQTNKGSMRESLFNNDTILRSLIVTRELEFGVR